MTIGRHSVPCSESLCCTATFLEVSPGYNGGREGQSEESTSQKPAATRDKWQIRQRTTTCRKAGLFPSGGTPSRRRGGSRDRWKYPVPNLKMLSHRTGEIDPTNRQRLTFFLGIIFVTGTMTHQAVERATAPASQH